MLFQTHALIAGILVPFSVWNQHSLFGNTVKLPKCSVGQMQKLCVCRLQGKGHVVEFSLE